MRGFLFGIGQFGVGIYWVYNSFEVVGLPIVASTACVMLLILFLALFPASMSLAFAALRTRTALSSITAFAALWVLFEWLRGWLFTGFPWLFAGYAVMNYSIASFAPIGGVLLLSLVAALMAGGIRFAATSTSSVAFVLAPLVLGGILTLLEPKWTEVRDEKSVALVQGNLPIYARHNDESNTLLLEKYAKLTRSIGNVDLIVWPEIAVNEYISEIEPWLEGIRDFSKTALIVGLWDRRRDGVEVQIYNAALVVGTGSGIYHKRRLVLFGETVPFADSLKSLFDFLDFPMNDLSSGEMDQPTVQASGIDIAIEICFEIAYGAMVAKDADNHGLLVTISEDGWFGDSIGPHQHLQIARMRSLETGRFLVRGTNQGITAIIQPDGTIIERAPQFETKILQGHVRIVEGSTPYMRWFDIPVVIACFLILVPGLVGLTFQD